MTRRVRRAGRDAAVLATAGERLALLRSDRAVWDGGVKAAEAVTLVACASGVGPRMVRATP
jgi:hypothetical protein